MVSSYRPSDRPTFRPAWLGGRAGLPPFSLANASYLVFYTESAAPARAVA